LNAAIRYFQITSRRKSRESCFRLRVLLTSEPTSCRNSREDYLLLELFGACEPDHAATRVETVLFCGHILLSNHDTPQLEQRPSHTRVTSYLLLRIHNTMPQLARELSLPAETLLANYITSQLARSLLPKAHHAANRVGLAGNCSYSSNHCSLPPNQPATYVTLKLRTQAASLDWSQILSSNTHPSTTRVKATVRGIPSPDSTFSG
jgi:hypothetical protein